MQQIKIPVTDSGAFDVASGVIEKNSLLFNKENDTLYIKRPEVAIPLGSRENYEKGLTQFYFCGIFNVLVEWPKLGHGAVIFLSQEADIDSQYIHKGFWVNVGNEINAEWKPFCDGTSKEAMYDFDAIPVGTILKFLLPDSFIPNGFQKCDGSSLKCYDYPDLFTVLGFNYGYGTTELVAEQDEYFCVPSMEAPLYTYIIKAKPTSYSNLEGTVTQFCSTVNSEKFKDIRNPISNLENLQLYLDLPDTVKTSENENEYSIVPIENQYVNHIMCVHNCSSFPVGTIVYIPKGYTPDGFLPCDGSQVRIVDFKELFDATASRFGRTATTFNLPHVKADYVDACIYTGKSTKFFIGDR